MQWIRACSGVVQGSDVQCCAADGIVSLYLCCTAGVTMTCTGFEWLPVRLTVDTRGEETTGSKTAYFLVIYTVVLLRRNITLMCVMS
jgi:hypothetical protein